MIYSNTPQPVPPLSITREAVYSQVVISVAIAPLLALPRFRQKTDCQLTAGSPSFVVNSVFRRPIRQVHRFFHCQGESDQCALSLTGKTDQFMGGSFVHTVMRLSCSMVRIDALLRTPTAVAATFPL